jgi:hypothetical protein
MTGITNDTKFSSQLGVFEDLFHGFFTIIAKHEETIHAAEAQCLYNHLDNNPSRFNRIPKYERMYKYFSIFVDYALQNITVYNEQSLYDGLSTQIQKFMKTAKLFDFDSYTYYPCICQDPYGPTFMEVMWNIDNVCYIRTQKFETESVLLKDLNHDVRTRKVQGHRKDYEKYIYNKGLNKVKRERFNENQHKNKKFRDYSVV